MSASEVKISEVDNGYYSHVVKWADKMVMMVKKSLVQSSSSGVPVPLQHPKGCLEILSVI